MTDHLTPSERRLREAAEKATKGERHQTALATYNHEGGEKAGE